MSSLPPLSKVSQVYPMHVPPYKEFVPSASDDVKVKVNNLVQEINRLRQESRLTVKQWNEVMVWVLNNGVTEAVTPKLSEVDDKILEVNEKMTSVNELLSAMTIEGEGWSV